MIDLHSHALPAIDDGAKDVKTSIKMLTDSFSQGVEICALKPHCVLHQPDSLEKFLKARKAAFELLQYKLKQENISAPELRLGAEVYFDNDISQYDDIKKLCIEGTNLLLVEFPMQNISRKSYEWLYSLTLKGIKPLIAHVDRYQCYEALINDFSDLDVAYQLNAENFLTFFGRRHIKKILRTNEKFVIGSDMHNLEDRPCNMQAAFLRAEKMLGTFKARKLFKKNAADLLSILM